jgi:hypothetical protein
MGINFSHGDAHWSYGGFMSFRQRLAREIGIEDLNQMCGFGGTVPWTTVHDDLKLLLNHSDCDGTLGPKTCAKVAKRLHQIVAKWPNNDGFGPDYDKLQATELIKGMKKAAKRGESLIFC